MAETATPDGWAPDDVWDDWWRSLDDRARERISDLVMDNHECEVEY